jgi:predicted site-specific integrase-resolvase
MVNLRDFVNIKEAAALVGAHPETLRRWDASGKLKARRHPVNGYRLYLRADLNAFLAKLKEGKAPNTRSPKTRRGGGGSKC